MNESRTIGCILQQGKALIHAIEALEIIEPTRPIERVQVWFLLQAYRRRLRAIVVAAPSWLAEGIPSASEQVGGGRSEVWLSEN